MCIVKALENKIPQEYMYISLRTELHEVNIYLPELFFVQTSSPQGQIATRLNIYL